MSAIDPDRAYRTAAGFFAELKAQGVAHAIVSPGSRSTPLTVTADATVGLDCHVVIDERSAGFVALGLARATGSPVALICTSGTAAANYLPAVVEAHYSRVPLVVCTADRPPELRDRGAGQTIDQLGLFGSHVRWFHDLPVASDVDAGFGRQVAARAIATATGPHGGPVHLNWPLREPLTPANWRPGTDAPVAAVRLDRGTTPPLDLTGAADTTRGLIVVGPGDLAPTGGAVGRLAEVTGWPVLAEATSSLRCGPHVAGRPFLTYWDLLLRDDSWADAHTPELVLRLGGSPTSKALRLWLERHRPHLVLVDPAARFEDPSALVGSMMVGVVDDAAAESAAAVARGSTEWTRRWTEADARLGDGVARLLGQGPLLEPGIVAALDRSLPPDSVLVVSNSMPVRDVDGYLPVSERPLRVLANRGASGIDGVTSTAFGVAAGGLSTVLLTGDVALSHDIGGLHAGVRAGLDLVVVVADNGGGGIFEFLPVAARPDIDFERLFLTPGQIDWPGVAALAGVAVHEVSTAEELVSAVDAGMADGGVSVVRVAVDRKANVAQHGQLAALVNDLPR